MATSLTRRVGFSAAHAYRIAAWSEERNTAAFGVWSHTHAHEYTCDVTVTGTPDPMTGFVVDLALLDRVLRAEVSERFHRRDIDRDVPEFGEAGMMSSCENLARFICEQVQAALAGAARVTRVVVAEDASLSAAYEPGPA